MGSRARGCSFFFYFNTDPLLKERLGKRKGKEQKEACYSLFFFISH